MPMNPDFYLVFSDLDGSLVDHDTYDFGEAVDALDFLKKRRIPVIICSSKTRLEIELYRNKMAMEDPFISENGGAIFIPEGKLSLTGLHHRVVNGFLVIELGKPYHVIKQSFRQIKDSLGLNMKGFSDMKPDEIAELTNLPLEEARLASMREYSEPFVFEDHINRFAQLEDTIRRYGLTLTKGGRFYHLMAGNDKGKAVQIVKGIYQQSYPHQTTVSLGIGDSLNDLPMLEQVDMPVLVRKKNGEYEPCSFKNICYAEGMGPRGWSKAIFKILKGESHG
jgi:mannosyl-3-phosphoglycerate phosphatase